MDPHKRPEVRASRGGQWGSCRAAKCAEKEVSGYHSSNAKSGFFHKKTALLRFKKWDDVVHLSFLT